MSIFQFVAKENAKRADAFIPLQVETLSRSECVRLIEEEKIRINGSVISKKQPICIGDVIEITIDPPKQIDIEAENIPLDILYQDHDIAVINKPQGMVVHPAHGNDTGTLVHAVMLSTGSCVPELCIGWIKILRVLSLLRKMIRRIFPWQSSLKAEAVKSCILLLPKGFLRNRNFVLKIILLEARQTVKRWQFPIAENLPVRILKFWNNTVMPHWWNAICIPGVRIRSVCILQASGIPAWVTRNMVLKGTVILLQDRHYILIS